MGYLLRVLTLLLVAFPALSASWYFRPPGGGGATNGTSWADAWTNSAGIDWTSSGVMPGDTIYVSRGTTGATYYTTLAIQKDGTLDNYITVAPGRDAGHDGGGMPARFINCKITPNGDNAQWNKVDGAKDPNFVAPANFMQVTNGATAITNNIGFQFVDIVATSGTEVYDPVGWFMREAHNITMRYCEWYGMTNSSGNPFHETDGSVVYIAPNSGDYEVTNHVYEYNFFHDNAGQQIAMNGNVVTRFGMSLTIRFNHFHNNGEDHIETGGGILVYGNVIGPCSGSSVHNDMGQNNGNFIKIYGNAIAESANAIWRLQTYPDPPSRGLRHSFWFYNNIVTEKLGRAGGGGTVIEPFVFVHESSLLSLACEWTTYSNIVVANNLFYNSITNTIDGVEGNPQLARSPAMSWSKGIYVTNSEIKASLFVNNLWVDKHKGVQMADWTNGNGNYASGVFRGYEPYTTNDLFYDYNTHAFTNGVLENPDFLSYMNVWTNVSKHPYQFSNRTNYPAWADKENEDFELLATDQAALNNGYDMSAYFTDDALFRPRNIGGAWDRGPLEAQETNLLMHLTFEDDFSDDTIDDVSGNGNHAHRFGRPGSSYPTNFPTRVAASISAGTNSSGYAGNFAWFTNEYGFYSKDGQYGAMTNVAPFTNLNLATIAFWARAWPYSSNAVCIEGDYRCDQQAAVLSAGTSTGIPGTWEMARRDFNTVNKLRWQVMTNQSTFARHEIHFPDPGFGEGQTDGDTLQWHHYAVTWSNGVHTVWYDGTNYAEADISGVVTNLTVAGNGGIPSFIGIGCYTHGGTPELEDESGVDYPNHGWWNGLIDDVRIYNRTLTSGEIAAIAGIDEPEEGGGEEPDPPSASIRSRTGTGRAMKSIR